MVESDAIPNIINRMEKEGCCGSVFAALMTRKETIAFSGHSRVG